jgi:Na+-driven multidrug efflux pump
VFALFLPAGSSALAIAAHMNRIVTPSFIFFGISLTLFGVVRATGAVMAPLIILTIALLAVRFPLAAAFLPRYLVNAVWWSFPLSSLLAALLALLYYRYGGWRSLRLTLPARAA